MIINVRNGFVWVSEHRREKKEVILNFLEDSLHPTAFPFREVHKWLYEDICGNVLVYVKVDCIQSLKTREENETGALGSSCTGCLVNLTVKMANIYQKVSWSCWTHECAMHSDIPCFSVIP